MECNKVLIDILTEKQVFGIINQNHESYELEGYNISPACEGLSGFNGEHFKIALYVKKGKISKKIKLFVKRVPRVNKPKGNFIDEKRFFSRESLVFKLIEETGAAEGSNPFCAKAYIHNENIVVMPDLSVDGYTIRPLAEYLDLDHVLVTVRSLARFHAAVANNFTRKSQNEDQYKALLEEIKDAIIEPQFEDSPWLRATAKLTVNFLREFSTTFGKFQNDLEEKLIKSYVKDCEDLREHPHTLNAIVHKDMWVNNIMFKYEDNVPTNAILIDYQCIRYGPPAFDLMSFLYLTTSKTFREENEVEIINYYFSLFYEHIDNMTKLRLMKLDYNIDSFRNLCEYARGFGMMQAISIFPYILMEPKLAQVTFDDPETHYKYMNVDRSEPVIAHAHESLYYRNKQLEIMEEYMARFIKNVI